MQLVLRTIAIVSFIVAIVWWFVAPGFEPLSAVLVGLLTLLTSFAVEKPGGTETLDQRNRRVMLDHVENFWVRGILEKSLHGVALLELGIKEDPTAVNYPWTIKKEATDEVLPPGKSMLEIFREIGAGRSLLILGEPGAGKTTMLLELARQLIECARGDEQEPIPIVFNLASWNGQSLPDWLAEQLNTVYYVPKKIAPSWVESNKMLLLLDGLDEVKKDRRAKCVEAINTFRHEHGLTSLVVCCRIEEYIETKTKLTFQGAITLQSLTSDQISSYIDRFGNRLATIRLLLSKDEVLKELAETPLMLSIMVLAYQDVNTNDLKALGNIEDQRKHLFNTYVERMFQRSTRHTRSQFMEQETLHYLKWLARKMIQYNIITYQIESMQLSWLEHQPHRRLYGLSAGLIFGLIFGLSGGLIFWLMFGISYWLMFGLIYGLVIGLMLGPISGEEIKRNNITMIDKLAWSWLKVRENLDIVLSGALIGGLIFGLIVALSVGMMSGVMGKLIFWLIFWLIGGLIGGLIYGLNWEQVEETTYPGQHLNQSFSNALLTILIFGLIVVLSVVLIGMLVGGLSVALRVGLIFGLIFGLVGGMMGGLQPVIQHYSLRWVLVRYGLLPFPLISFLEYCVDLIFLRRVGGSYIFVHRLLMEHFAEMRTEQGEVRTA